MICACENPHCKATHMNRDDDWLFRVVRENLTWFRQIPDADRGDLVTAVEAILAAAKSRYDPRPPSTPEDN